MNYVKRNLIAIDQLGNTLCDGHPDTTISARLHWLEDKGLYFHTLRVIVDFAFYPFDGKNHCKQAYELQPHTVLKGSNLALGFLGVLVVTCCIPISVISYTYLLGSKCAKIFK